MDDTIESLTRLTDIAAREYSKVSHKYIKAWISLEEGDRVRLETYKSKNLDVTPLQPQSPGIRCNEEAYLSFLYINLGKHMDKFKEKLKVLEAATGVKLVVPDLKGRSRSRDKAYYDYDNNYTRLVDVGRASAIATSLPQLMLAYDWVLANFEVVRAKNRCCDARSAIIQRGGYRDVLFNIKLKDFCFELQLHLAILFDMKEEAHKILDYARAMIEPALFKIKELKKREDKEALMDQINRRQADIDVLKFRLEGLFFCFRLPFFSSLPFPCLFFFFLRNRKF